MSADRRDRPDDRDPDLVRAFGEMTPRRPASSAWQSAVWAEIERGTASPWWRGWKWIAVLGPALAVVFAVVLVRESKQSARKDRELAMLTAAIDDRSAEIDRQVAEVEERYRALLAAKTEEEQAAARRELEEAQAELAEKQATLKNLLSRKRRAGGGSFKADKTLEKVCPPDDVLCGLGGGRNKVTKECGEDDPRCDESTGRSLRATCAPDDPLCGL